MLNLPGTLDKVMNLLAASDTQQKVIASIIATLVVAALARLWQTARAGTSTLMRITLMKWRRPWANELADYRAKLDDQIFRIRHSWMKGGQTLKDILVPVAVMSGGELGAIEELRVAISGTFAASDAAPRIAIIGGPGSGKSVALRALASYSWNLPSTGGYTGYVPVFFTFSQYRHDDYDLQQAIMRSLRSWSFFGAKTRNGEAALGAFVTDQMAIGRLLVLVDGLDELDANDRTTAFLRIQEDIRQYPATPICVSCRSAAWPGAQGGFQIFQTAPFSDHAIRHFLQNWNFRPPKSAAALSAMIAARPHLAELARSPLMLTIMAFIYSQPRYRLPENRAQFYEVCTRALLEEWDQDENPERANRFDRPHKEFVLARLAYDHLQGTKPAEDIEESEALRLFADAMAELGLLKSDNVKLLTEICLNAGLLVRLPPSGLRFPHQTFLEFFATLHLLALGSPAMLLRHYWDDPARWREVLLLYCGLTSDTNQTSDILQSLLANAKPSLNMALVALTEARTVRHDVAGEVLTTVEGTLTHLGENVTSAVDSAIRVSSRLTQQDLEAASVELVALLRSRADSLADVKSAPSTDLDVQMADIEESISGVAADMLSRLRKRRVEYRVEVDEIWNRSGTSLTELIEHLGYFAAHTHSAYSDRATGVLRSLLTEAARKRFPKELLEPLLVAILRRPTDEIVGFVIDHAQELDFRRIVPAMGDSALAMAASVLGESQLTLEKKVEWIDGLRRAGAVKTLYGILITAEIEPRLQSAVAVALARCSQSKEFWECMDQTERLPMLPDVSRFYELWSWPFDRPRNDLGKRMVFLLADELALEMRNREAGALLACSGDVHPWIAYLALGRAKETGGRLPLPHDAEPAKSLEWASMRVIRSVWRKMSSHAWVGWIGWYGRADSAAVRLATTMPFLITYAWSAVAVVAHVLGLGDAGIPWVLAVMYVAFWGATAVYAFAVYDIDLAFIGFVPSVSALATCRSFDVSSNYGRATIWSLWALLFIFVGVIVFAQAHPVVRVLICLVPLQWSAMVLWRATLPPLLANSQTAALCEWLKV